MFFTKFPKQIMTDIKKYKDKKVYSNKKLLTATLALKAKHRTLSKLKISFCAKPSFL